MDGHLPLDGATIEARLNSLLRENPTALVAAIGADGIFVPMPDSINVGDHQLLPGHSAMDFVAAGDWDAVISAWEATRVAGVAHADVRLNTARDHRAAMHYFDLCERHGVFVGTLLGPGIEIAMARLEAVEDAPPRIARAVKDDVAAFVEVDDAFLQILGWSAEDMIGHRSLEFIHPDDEEVAIRSWMAMLAARDAGPRVRMRHRHRDGSWVWLEVNNYNFLDDPERPHVEAEMIDVSDEVAAHDAVRRRERLFSRLAEALPTGLIHLDHDRHVVYANERLAEILGTGPAGFVDERLATVVRDDWPGLDTAIANALRDGGDTDLEVQIRPLGGSGLRRCIAKVRALIDDGMVTGAIISIEDITESAQLRLELERRANLDTLTRCLNRATIMSALEAVVAHDDDATVAVLFIDLDEFKSVNDSHGHAVGDELLIVASERLTGAVRQGDFVGRLGGDEFLVVCPEISGLDEAKALADRIARALHGVSSIEGHTVELRASVGVACAPRRGACAEDLVSRADAAMYAAKRNRAPGGSAPDADRRDATRPCP